MFARLATPLFVKIAGGAFLFVLIAGGLYIWSLISQIHAHERTIAAQGQRIERLVSDLTQCRANRAALEQGIARQNEAIAEMRRQGEAREAELDRVAANARREAETATARARRIMGARAGADQCADARALILETVR